MCVAEMNDVSGVVNYYKERGPTSFRSTDKIKKLFEVRKAGHGGTLDPEAEGVLPVFLGFATRISSLFLKAEKEYRVFLRFGLGTDTFDMAGKVTEKTDDFSLDRTTLVDALKTFEGSYLQKPPRFSALKVKGRRAYDLARRGVDFELEPRKVTCREIECVGYNGIEAEVFIACEAGFYIRSMARDLAKIIGIPVTARKIIRERSGFLKIDSAYRFEDLLDKKKNGKIHEAVITIDNALPNLPGIFVDRYGEFSATCAYSPGNKCLSWSEYLCYR
jgi:tRNA pseudouridine55 synthase